MAGWLPRWLAGVELEWPNGRTAGWLVSKSAHVADLQLLPLISTMTLATLSVLLRARFVPAASACPSQDRHEPWLLERPNASTPNNRLRAGGVQPCSKLGADTAKLGHDHGHGLSRNPDLSPLT